MITKLANGRQQVRVFRHGLQVSMATFDRLKDAESWEAAQKLALTTGTWADPRLGDTALSVVLAEFLESRLGAISQHAYDTDEANLRLHLPGAIKRRPIRTTNASHLQDVYTKLLRTKSIGTVRRVRDSFVALFAYAVARKYISFNPAEESKVPRGTGAVVDKIRPLTESESEVLIDAARAHYSGYGNLVEFAVLTGARWGELAELRVSDIVSVPLPSIRIERSHSDGYEVTSTKSRRSRRVPLVSRAQEIIAAQAAGKKANDLLFTAPRGGPMNAGNVKRAIRWNENAAGHRFHDLRHTAATRWILSGLDIKTVSVWLGHADSAITHRVYSGWLGGDADLAAVQRLEAAAEQKDGVVLQLPASRA